MRRPFQKINKAYNSVFEPGELSIGIVSPIENYAQSTVPTLQHHLSRVQLAESLGFKAVWVRDVPLHVPQFGDAGQTFDPFTYLGYLAGQTSDIALCTGSIALPLHHPIHVAKSAATIDQLSGGRLILGVASGDRPSEFPSLGIDFESRGESFRDAFHYIRLGPSSFPKHSSDRFGELTGYSDVLPKPSGHKIPMLVTGHSRQDISWISEHADGWMYYPRNFYMQEFNISEWRKHIPAEQEVDKPFMQPLYVDLHPDKDYAPQHIHLGFRLGANHLVEYFHQLKKLGVNHVGINLRFSQRKIEEVLEQLAEHVLPHFHTNTSNKLENQKSP